MDRGGDERRQLRLDRLATLLRDPEVAPEQALGGRGAEQHQRLGLHQVELLVEPGPAGVDLEALGRLVDAPPTALLELEVLHHVRDVDVVTRDPDGLERPVELAPGRSHERAALAVLLVAGLLPDEHGPGALQPFAEDGLARVAPQMAAATVTGSLPHSLQ